MSNGREWYPAAWVDETCPPPKARPEDFVAAYGETYQLGYAPDDNSILDDEDREVFTEQLAIGDIVDFMCCDRFDDVDLTIFREGGWHLHYEAPVGHNWVTVNSDIDTLHDSFDELIDAIRDPADDLQAYVFHDDAKIIKNGTIDIAAGEGHAPAGFLDTAGAFTPNCCDFADGTDYYELWAYSASKNAANDVVIDGNPAHTWFCGSVIGGGWPSEHGRALDSIACVHGPPRVQNLRSQ